MKKRSGTNRNPCVPYQILIAAVILVAMVILLVFPYKTRIVVVSEEGKVIHISDGDDVKALDVQGNFAGQAVLPWNEEVQKYCCSDLQSCGRFLRAC